MVLSLATLAQRLHDPAYRLAALLAAAPTLPPAAPGERATVVRAMLAPDRSVLVGLPPAGGRGGHAGWWPPSPREPCAGRAGIRSVLLGCHQLVAPALAGALAEQRAGCALRAREEALASLPPRRGEPLRDLRGAPRGRRHLPEELLDGGALPRCRALAIIGEHRLGSLRGLPGTREDGARLGGARGLPGLREHGMRLGGRRHVRGAREPGVRLGGRRRLLGAREDGVLAEAARVLRQQSPRGALRRGGRVPVGGPLRRDQRLPRGLGAAALQRLEAERLEPLLLDPPLPQADEVPRAGLRLARVGRPPRDHGVEVDEGHEQPEDHVGLEARPRDQQADVPAQEGLPHEGADPERAQAVRDGRPRAPQRPGAALPRPRGLRRVHLAALAGEEEEEGPPHGHAQQGHHDQAEHGPVREQRQGRPALHHPALVEPRREVGHADRRQLHRQALDPRQGVHGVAREYAVERVVVGGVVAEVRPPAGGERVVGGPLQVGVAPDLHGRAGRAGGGSGGALEVPLDRAPRGAQALRPAPPEVRAEVVEGEAEQVFEVQVLEPVEELVPLRDVELPRPVGVEPGEGLGDHRVAEQAVHCSGQLQQPLAVPLVPGKVEDLLEREHLVAAGLDAAQELRALFAV
mmetsp:Transcript_96461/g.273155  ORF Transcript_96461/g.273155 Transcript_96461/m.273155 type:complete len:634 (-) Transcript_96461:288-2189(-)